VRWPRDHACSASMIESTERMYRSGRKLAERIRKCYVRIDPGPLLVHKALQRGHYPAISGHKAIADLGRSCESGPTETGPRCRATGAPRPARPARAAFPGRLARSPNVRLPNPGESGGPSSVTIQAVYVVHVLFVNFSRFRDDPAAKPPSAWRHDRGGQQNREWVPGRGGSTAHPADRVVSITWTLWAGPCPEPMMEPGEEPSRRQEEATGGGRPAFDAPPGR
jgi:hypothetical protein